jgi:predicted ester cyclase
MSPEESKALIRHIYEDSLSAHDLGKIDEYFAPDYVDHAPGTPGPMDREAFKQYIGMYFAAFPDGRFTIEDIVVEGDKAAWRETFTGTHQGDLMGIPPTGKQVHIDGISYGRMRDGKALEHWGSGDNLGMLQQLGVIPMMGAAPTGAGA